MVWAFIVAIENKLNSSFAKNGLMASITLREGTFRKLEKLRRNDEPIDEVIERLIESYEELQNYIEEKWEKVVKDRGKFITIDEYESSRGL
ncbi:DUF7557 family protein [Geoglobus ahangari]